MLSGVSTHIHVLRPLNNNLLKGIRDAGFDTVELYANPPHWPDYDKPSRRWEIAGICLDLGLPIHSVHTPFFRNLNEARAGKWLSLTSKDPEVRRESAERIAESIGIAEFAPVGCAVIHLGTHEEKADGGTYDRLYYSLEEILQVSRKLGVTLALENLTNDISRGHQIAHFINESGLEGVGCCYDCGHAALYERTVEELHEMAPWLASAHIHDISDGKDNHLMPFDGEIDWPSLASAFADTGYDGALIIETKDEEGSAESLKEAAKAARRLIEMIKSAKEGQH